MAKGINKNRKKKSKKVKPLLGVLNPTCYAGTIFTNYFLIIRYLI